MTTPTRMTAEEYQKTKSRRHKYGAKVEVRHGITFPSILEADCYDELRLLEAAGEIEDLQRQVKVPLVVNGQPICYWRCDFQYWDKRQQQCVWREAKGKMTADARIKIALARAIYPNMRIELWPVRN